jgi:hypothetical protein
MIQFLIWLFSAPDSGDPDVPDGNIGSGPRKWWDWI